LISYLGYTSYSNLVNPASFCSSTSPTSFFTSNFWILLYQHFFSSSKVYEVVWFCLYWLIL